MSENRYPAHRVVPSESVTSVDRQNEKIMIDNYWAGICCSSPLGALFCPTIVELWISGPRCIKYLFTLASRGAECYESAAASTNRKTYNAVDSFQYRWIHLFQKLSKMVSTPSNALLFRSRLVKLASSQPEYTFLWCGRWAAGFQTNLCIHSMLDS